MPFAGADEGRNNATARAKSTYRLLAAKHRKAGARRNREIFGEDHGRGVGGREMRDIARVVDERDVAVLRLVDAGDTHDLDRRIALEPALQRVGKLAQPHQRIRFLGSRFALSVSDGRPACSQAETMTEAVAVMAADRRSSSSGLTFVKKASK